jgi:predicted GH43/DUF377 family glycosyl hydrolase
MARLIRWRKEPGARVDGSRDLDRSKVQAPCIVRVPEGGYRLYYTAVGPGKPFADCQGYILSAVSDDGLRFEPEPGIRVAPDPAIPHLSLRALAPSVIAIPGGWRMYFEARGPASRPTVICSAVSADQVSWQSEEGIRLETAHKVGAPRASVLPDGRVRLIVFRKEGDGTSIISATSDDGLTFAIGPTTMIRDRTDELDVVGITAAEIIPGNPPMMVLSCWQDRPTGSAPPPLHPSLDPNAVAAGLSADFAAASIAADMSGYRSRIFIATTEDGAHWTRGPIVIEGDGYGGHDIDAVHAEDMSVIALGDGRYRMYYAACDAHGVWRVASAISE